MGEWLKDNPVLSSLINIALCIIIMLLFIRMYVYRRIDDRIINEYQKPIIEKLDTLINYYDGNRYGE